MKTSRVLKSSLLAIIILTSLTMLIGFIKKPPSTIETQGIINIAHRGASEYAPENTMAAFNKAIESGADYIECDVHLSKDNELVIIHDEKLNRTTNGSGYVNNFTLQELRKLDAGSKFHPSFAGERIITLEELLEAHVNEVGIIIDIKNPHKYLGIEERIAETLNQYDHANIIIQSNDINSIKEIHRLHPNVPVGVLVSRSQHPLSEKQLDEIATFATYINYNIKYLNANIVAEIHKRDKKVMAWTIREKRSLNKALDLGVDGIITGYTDWLIDGPIYVAK